MSTCLNISSNVVKPPLTPLGGKSPHEAHSLVRGKQTLPLSSVHHSGTARPGNSSRIVGRSRDNLSSEQCFGRRRWCPPYYGYMDRWARLFTVELNRLRGGVASAAPVASFLHRC